MDGIAADHRFGRIGPFWQAIAVDQHMIGNRIQSFHRPGHRQHGRLQDIDVVNLGFTTLRDRKAGTIPNFRFEPGPCLGGQFLAVIQP